MNVAEPTHRLYIGSRVTYHGRFDELHDRPLHVLPCTWFGPCEPCDELAEEEEDGPPADRTHFLVVDLSTDQRVHHADQDSLTPLPHTWPHDAVALNIRGYWYAASHTTAGGGPGARTVHFHTAENFMGRTWCHFQQRTEEVLRLDAAARRRPAN